MASANFRNLVRQLATKQIAFDTDTCKVILMTTAPSEANLDAWVYRSSLTGEASNGNGYTTGGIAQAKTFQALDTTNNKQVVTWSNITNGWTGLTKTGIVGAVIYVDKSNINSDILVCWVDFGTTYNPTNSSFSITYSSHLEISTT